MYTLLWDPFINTVCQLRAYKYAHSSLGKVCWLNAGVEEFPPINSVRTTTLCPRDASNIQGKSFGFLDHFVLLPTGGCHVPVSKC